jgi:mRNA interferase RelE/StbE
LSYHVEVHRRVDRALKRLPAREAARVARAILDLRNTPRPPGVKKLAGGAHWRIRVGEYRVIFLIFDREQLVIVERLERRTTTTYD